MMQIDLFSNVIAPNFAKERNPMVITFGKREGYTCKSCKHLKVKTYASKYYKCEYRKDTKSSNTDHRLNWNACTKWEE